MASAMLVSVNVLLRLFRYSLATLVPEVPVPPMPLAVLVIFVGLYALATLRGVHLGVVMLPAAFVVGVGLVHLAMRDITTGFPVGIMLLLVGVT